MGRWYIAWEARIAAVWREVLHLDAVGVADNFFDLGGHSLALLRVHGRLREEISDVDLKIVDLFEHPTIGALAGHLATPGREAGSPVGGAPGREAGSRDFIAVIGMAGRFPGAADVDELWRNLHDGKESIAFFSREELEAEALRGPLSTRGILYTNLGPWAAGTATTFLTDSAGNDGGAPGQSWFRRRPCERSRRFRSCTFPMTERAYR